jgi:hypothetical protein
MYEMGTKYPDHFDGFLFLTVMFHIPRSRTEDAVRSLRTSLKQGAVGMLSTPGGTGTVKNTFGHPCTLYSYDELQRIFEKQSFRVNKLFSPDGYMILGSVLAI